MDSKHLLDTEKSLAVFEVSTSSQRQKFDDALGLNRKKKEGNMSATDNVSYQPPVGMDDLIPLPSVLIDAATGEVVDADSLAEHAVVVTQDDGTGLVLSRSSADKAAPVDENLKASMMRQGRSGLTLREGMRRKKFRPSASVEFPISYEGQSWENYNGHFMTYMDALAFRAMKKHGWTPEAMDAEKGRQAVAGAVLEQALSDDPGYVKDDTLERVRLYQGRAVLTAKQKAKKRRKGDTTVEHTFTHQLGYSVVEKAAESAAAWAWDHWDASVYENFSEWGRIGGTKSRKPKTYKMDAILALGFDKPEDHLAEIAEALGCSERTVQRRLKEYREEQSAYLSQPVDAPRQDESAYLSQETPETPAPAPVERSMRKHALRPLDTRTTEEIESSFWALLSEHKMALGMVKPVDEDMAELVDDLFDVVGTAYPGE